MKIVQKQEKKAYGTIYMKSFGYEKLFLAWANILLNKKRRLKDLEKQFEDGEINILSCSTTMEMGS